MLGYPSFMELTQPTSAQQPWNEIIITTSDSPVRTPAFISVQPPHAVYLKIVNQPKKLFLLNPTTKMEPVFDTHTLTPPRVAKIRLHNKGQMLAIQPTSPGGLILVYEKLKKTLAHHGFNEYFKPLKRLGKGAFATVYLVEHRFSGQKWAAKVFSREGQRLEYRGKQALDNEIYMLRLLAHPNIVQYEGVYQTDNLIYLVTEYLAGGTLEDTLRHKTALQGPLILGVLSDTLQALLELRKHAIVHRDLKPQNILLRDTDKKWVLADFGLAAQRQRAPLFYKCGTMGYMAPQIMAQGASLSHLSGNENNENLIQTSFPAPNDYACDLYSLGIIAYELIVGALPFKLESQGIFEKNLIWDGFNREQFKELEEEPVELLRGLLEECPEKRTTPQEALRSKFFVEPKAVEHWNRFCQAKIDRRFDKILKMANCN